MARTLMQDVILPKACVILLAFAILADPSEAGSNGAPLAACETLGDPHVVFPSQPIDESPFKVLLSKVAIDSGETVGITLSVDSRVDGSFKGYMIMAFDNTNQTIGTFENVLETKGQYMRCYDQPQSAVTHVNNNFKKEVRFDWRAPEDFDGEVTFKATFVENYWTFWAGVPSEVLSVGTDEQTEPVPSSTSPSTTSSSTSPSTPSTPTTLPPNSTCLMKPSTVITLLLLFVIKTLSF